MVSLFGKGRMRKFITANRLLCQQTYRDLFREDYLAITRKLGLKAPHEEPKCLACHASNVPKKYQGKKFAMTDGIGCETCHGGSEKYLATHTDRDATRASNIGLRMLAL